MSDSNWLVIKLTRTGEQSDEELLYAELKRIFGNDIEVFFPFKFPPLGYSKKITVLDGYIFLKNHIKTGFEVLLEKNYYFESLIINSNSFVDPIYVAKLKEKLRFLCESDYYENEEILITDGPYSNLEGIILSVSRKNVVVHIAIRSRELIVEVPKASISRFCPE